MRIRHPGRRTAGLAALGLLALVTVGGCAFLLDTDELKEGTGTAAAGSGGVAGQGGTSGSGGAAGFAGTAGMGAAAGQGGSGGGGGTAGTGGGGGAGGEAPRTCSDDSFLDCIEQPVDDPCTKDWCDNGVCQRIPHAGEGLVPETDATLVLDGQYEIGPPTLTIDGAGNYYLGFWHRVDTASEPEVVIRKHPVLATAAVERVTLREVWPELVQVHSSPALAPYGDDLRVALAATTDNLEHGMVAVELKLDDLSKPISIDGLDVLDQDSGYVSFPATEAAPRIALHGLQQNVIWPFAGDIRYRAWTALGDATVASFAGASATNLVPLPGPVTQKFGAVVEANVAGSEKLMVWNEGETTLNTEFDGTPGERLGLAAAAIEAKKATDPAISLVSWAYKDASERAHLKLGFADCDANACTAQTLGSTGNLSEGMRPSGMVRKEGSSDRLRRIALVYAVHAKLSETEAASALVVNLSRFDLDKPNEDIPVDQLPYNPPLSLVTPLDLQVPADPEDSPFRATATALAPDGKLMVVWVYQKPGGAASLWYRRYRMSVCDP